MGVRVPLGTPKYFDFRGEEMFYNAKEFIEQDLRYKGPMRRRYDELLEIYKGYNIHRYNRGEWERIGAEKIDDDLIVEADTIEEVKQWLDENVK